LQREALAIAVARPARSIRELIGIRVHPCPFFSTGKSEDAVVYRGRQIDHDNAAKLVSI
jgi:hypothetical protein